jgi:hypothetical protein
MQSQPDENLGGKRTVLIGILNYPCGRRESRLYDSSQNSLQPGPFRHLTTMADVTLERVRCTQVSWTSAPDGEAVQVTNERGSTTRTWEAPVTIVAALLLGVGTALAHHFMSANLNGKSLRMSAFLRHG